MHKETPSEVLFDALKCDLDINNRDAARILLSDRPDGSKPAPRLRVSEKTFLSRRVVHVVPGSGKIEREMFAEFSQSAQNLSSIAKANGAAAGAGEMVEILDRAVARMVLSLWAWGLNGSILNNTVERIAVAPGLKESDRRLLALIALVVCGCLADPSAAAAEVKAFAERRLSTTFGTLETSRTASPDVHGLAADAQPMGLGLLRIANDGSALPPIHVLSRDAAGNVIGAFAQGPHAVTDVGPDVSHRHLKLVYQDGTWLAAGLDSTNGTALVSQDGTVREIEAPRCKRPRGARQAPVPFCEGDLLELGSSTRYLVIRLSARACRAL